MAEILKNGQVHDDAWQVLRPGNGLWSHWRRFGLLSLLGLGIQ